MGKQHDINAETVELRSTDGVAFIEQTTPLSRLHYFDGKFLRADALALEQDYHRVRSRLGLLAGGFGVVHGLGITLAGDELRVGAGMAVTAAGNLVLAVADLQARLAELLGTAAPAPLHGAAAFAACPQPAPAGFSETAALAVYEITVGPIEGLCGNEAVYGKLCESACASDSQHPYWREGVVLRLRPITLQLPSSPSNPAGVVHLRNRIASAYFADETALPPALLSASGLAGGVWCQPATLYGRDEVVIGLLAREGGVNRVIDAWSGRRERIDAQARSHWQGRLAMRPWNAFVAQILQFQCQLAGLFEPGTKLIEPADDCDQLRELLERTRRELDGLVNRYARSTKKILFKVEGRTTAKEMRSVAADIETSFADLGGLSSQLAELEAGKGALPRQRMLLRAGFFELPPAGYLPVDPQIAVEAQMQRLFGDGVRLHYHAVRADEIAHLVEQAQHLQRISLTRGLDDARAIEQVEIFVPGGELRGVQALATGTWWRVEMLAHTLNALTPLRPKTGKVESGKAAAAVQISLRTSIKLDGLARSERRADGSFGVALVAATDTLRRDADADADDDVIDGKRGNASTVGNAGAERAAMAIYLAADMAADPFSLPVGGDTAVSAEIRTLRGARGIDIQLGGMLSVLARRTPRPGREQRLVQLDIQFGEMAAGGPDEGDADDVGTNSKRLRLRFLLQREGDRDAGVLMLDDERQDPQSSPVFFEWDDAPVRGVMYVQGDDSVEIVKRRFDTMRAAADAATASAPPAPPSIGVVTTGPSAALTRQQLLAVHALPAMPEPLSNLGAAAIHALIALADVSDDPAFLLRARRRLLPTLDAPKGQTVRARDDWLMFRRARTHLCGPACDTPPAAALEAFQIWHLKIDDDREQLARLRNALDNGDEKQLAGFEFRRVGVLRYRDASAFSEESADHVLAMWQTAGPAAQIVLGRVWENAPTTGQGWQNHFRLRNMLQQISALTQPPARGAGALAASALPSSRLADGALDGGMLIVSSGAREQQLVTHRTVLVNNSLYSDLLPTFQGSSQEGWKLLEELVAEQPDGLIDLSLHFSAGQLDASDAAKLHEADQVMRAASDGVESRTRALRIDATSLDPQVRPAAQHQAIGDRLKLVWSPPPAGGDDGAMTIALADLGNGAQVATLVGYEPEQRDR